MCNNFITKYDSLLSQSESGIAKFDRLLLQSVSVITKCDRFYYKVHPILQIVTVITKWDVTQVLLSVYRRFVMMRISLTTAPAKCYVSFVVNQSTKQFISVIWFSWFDCKSCNAIWQSGNCLNSINYSIHFLHNQR